MTGDEKLKTFTCFGAWVRRNSESQMAMGKQWIPIAAGVKLWFEHKEIPVDNHILLMLLWEMGYTLT